MTNNTSENEDTSPPAPPVSLGIERELFGKWSAILRNIAGLVAAVVVCTMGLFNSYTTYVSVNENKEWPSDMSIFMMVIGPIVISWTWVNVNKTITTIFTGVNEITRVRERLADIVAPKKKDPE